uniref:A-kinase anchor protein 13-like n=1 Tax=Anabas testudineus TaxID=64144 RepID=A0A7N5ZVI3_ANATE
MKLNPQQAPLYGECVLTVQLDDEDAGEEVEFYLLFSGSTQRHVSSTLRVSHITLQAVCPAHNVCEEVLVTLCLARPGGSVDRHSQETFCFVQNLALDMAHFLLDNTAPEEALLFDDDQIPLKECERLDQSLTLALKHLSLLQHRTAPQTPSLTCTHISTLPDSYRAVSQSVQLSSLLHLAASCGLRTVASFLLQQPGAREALRTTNTQGQTPACVAQGKGHEQLVELFRWYEASSDAQLEPKEQLPWYQEGRVFQHYTNLGTYTLTFPSWQHRVEGAEKDGDESCCIKKEIEELRRLIQLHRDSKGESCAGVITAISMIPACELQHCSSRRQESRWDADLIAVSTEKCSTTTEELKERTPSAVVTHTSCTSEHLCQSLEAAGGQRSRPTTKSPAGRKRKNKKRTTKTTRHVTETAGNNRRPLEANKVTAQKPTETIETSCLLEIEGTVSPRDPTVISVIGESEATKIQRNEETFLLRNPVAAPAGDKYAGKATTAITEKQEGEKWEVDTDVLMCEQFVKTETEQADNQSHSPRQDQFVESAAKRAVFMGQEQSHDPQESQSDSDEPSQPDSISKSPQSGSKTSPRSPDMEGKPRRVLWRDGGWIGSIIGSPPLGSHTTAKTVWYQSENMDQSVTEESNRKEVNSHTVWYDDDQQKPEQLEQTEWDLSSPHEFGKSPPQLLEQGLSSHQLCSALSQPHAAGAQPAQSHGLATQRKEVQGSQQEEEVRPDWQKGGEEVGSEEVRNRETTYSRKSSETADLEEGGEEKPVGEEKEAKGKKKRRKKRGKRGGTEAKLSSSSSIESQSLSETQTEQVTNLNPHSETESEAKDQTGRAHVHSPPISEPTQREEADKDAMHLPSQTESQTRDSHEPDSAVTSSESTYTHPTDHGRTDVTEVTPLWTLETKELSEDNTHCSNDFNLESTELIDMDNKKADSEEINTVQSIGNEILDPTELDLKGDTNPTVEDVEYKTLSENEKTDTVASMDQMALLESKFPKELPVKSSEPTELTEDLFLVVFPEEDTQHTQSVDSYKPLQPVHSVEKPNEFLECTHLTEAVCLLCEGTADATPLQIREGSPETSAREYLEHCFSSEMLRDQQHKEEKRHELWVVEEEAGKETSLERTSEEYDFRVVCSEALSSIDEERKFPSSDTVSVQKYNEDLVATAVAVVAVAVASAMARIELSQQLSGKPSQSSEEEYVPTIAQDASEPTENQPIQHSHTQSTDQFCSEGQNVSQSVKLLCKTETDTHGLPPLYKEGIESETTMNKLFTCPLSEEEDKLLAVNIKPLPEKNDLIRAEVNIQGHMQTQIQLSCPLVDTGQPSELPSETFCPDSESNHKPQDHSVCQKESNGQFLGTHFQNKEMCTNTTDRDGSFSVESLTPEGEEGGSLSVESLTPEGEEGGSLSVESFTPEGEEGGSLSVESLTPEGEEGGSLFVESFTPEGEEGGSLSVESLTPEGEEGGQVHNSCLKSITDMSHSDCQAKEHKSDPHLSKIPHQGESRTLPLSWSPTLPVTQCDSAPVANSSPGEQTAPAIMESGKLPTSCLLEDPKLVAATFQNKSDKLVAVDHVYHVCDQDSDTLDTVDGWKHRERTKLELEEYAREDMVTAENTSHTETKTFPVPEVESEHTRRDSDSTHTLQIRREKDICYPVQPCPQPSTVTSCTDIHPDGEECVSVCVLQRDDKSLQINAELDDTVFKKPDPPPSVAHWDIGVPVSTDDVSMQGDIIPIDSTAGTGDAVAPRSSRLSWKSETEDRGGGGVTEGGGEEREKAQLPQNPISSAILRASIRSMSPLCRHSWEPGRSSAVADIDIPQRSSLQNLSGKAKRAKPPLHRRSMSWCPSNLSLPGQEQIDSRSYSLERLEVERGGVQTQCPGECVQEERTAGRSLHLDTQERGSLISLTEEEQEGDAIGINSQTSSQVLSMTSSYPAMFHHQTLTKSISMVTISHRDIDGLSSFSSNTSSLENSISEEEPGPLRSETEGKGGPTISRTLSYLRSKISKKGKEKERKGDRERENKEREKKTANGHLFIPVSQSPSTACQHCTKLLHNKETFLCNNCGVHVHKSCRESLSVCTKSKTKQQSLVPDTGPGSAVNMRSKSTSSTSSVSSTSPSSSREQWSTVTTPDDQLPAFSWRPPSILNSHSNLAKSISISNIAGLDDAPLKALKFLSQSTDNLHQGSKVNASTESLTDEGTEMMDSQLMGEFECDIKDLEADSWSGTVDKKFLKTLKKDEIKKQDVIYELYQTEFHHVRTLKIMSEVYYKGLQREMQLDTQTLDKIFPVLDDLLDTHSQFLIRLLDTKRASSGDGRNNNSFLIRSIGSVLVTQFSGINADRMKKVYGKFCSRHNEAVNLYKDFHAKDKRFQAFIKKTMSSSIVRRLNIPECILLVTQRITKYPVLIQRILQHTKDSDGDYSWVCESLRCVKELITAVDSKVNEHEKKRRLREVYSRTDSKSIMRMKSGQMFAKEDLIRGRKLLHDGALQLKNYAGRLKDVHAILLSDVLVFLQEKDQKYVFASLDQRSTVISLQTLIVREVANEERGLFLITAGTDRPEMVEVLASSKEERNTWRAIIQEAMHCMEKDEDEGVPSETEEDKKQQENRAKEIRGDSHTHWVQEHFSIFSFLCEAGTRYTRGH